MVSEAFPLGTKKCFCLSSRKTRIETKKIKKLRKKENRSGEPPFFHNAIIKF